jgi:hypothetical protein
MERISRGLAKFDSLELQKDKDELQALVDALRRCLKPIRRSI